MRALVVLVCLLVSSGVAAQERIRLATTTSTENSGLLAVLLPPFEARFRLGVDVIPVGSGKALKLAENGDVDVVLSHAPALEEEFVRDGFGVNPRQVMYNDFVLVGPEEDRAHLREASGVADAFGKLVSAGAEFISRGDESGTHEKELEVWKAAGIVPGGDWYLSAGLGMGAVLRMADEREAYTLADRGTFLAYRRRGDLTIVCEGDAMLRNPYTIIAVNPARHPGVHYIEAMQLIAWVTSPDGQRVIGSFTVGGEVLFHPLAGPGSQAPSLRPRTTGHEPRVTTTLSALAPVNR